MIKFSVVLVPFPFDDFSGSKARPALCLTNKIGRFNQVIITFISSNTNQTKLDTDILIEKESHNWKGTGLFRDSLIRLHKIVTVPGSLIKRKLGSINNDLQVEVLDKLHELLTNK
jgi:mRNA interferase MazF